MEISRKIILAAYVTLAVLALASIPAFAQESLTVDLEPPALPTYEQPACPSDGYIWTPGYWAYGDYGYFWVPGTWVQPPEPGLLWTPCYWGWSGNQYAFNQGYWGPEVGFYGGINYGYGYGGNGYGGGRWQGRDFFYNTEVNNVGEANVRNRYDDATAVRTSGNVSYNGGTGGVQAEPSAEQRQLAGARHVRATPVQMAHLRAASLDRGQVASLNGGQPATTAVSTPRAYKAVALQHVKTQPLTRQDSIKERQAASAKTSPGLSANPQVSPEKQDSPAAPTAPPTESREAAVPHDAAPAVTPRPQTETQIQPRPQPEERVQPKPQPEERAQPRPQPEAAAKPRPEAQAKPPSRPEGADKPAANKQQPNQ